MCTKKQYVYRNKYDCNKRSGGVSSACISKWWGHWRSYLSGSCFNKRNKKLNPEARFLYIGTENGLESTIVPKAGIPFQSIVISGFKRKISLDNVKTVMRFLKGVQDSKRYIRRFNPDIVIGTGGYVCGPVVYAAAKLGIPTIVHEQNSVPGVTNKFLSRYVDKVAVCFEAAAEHFPQSKVVMTGNPRASEVMDQNGMKGKRSVGLSLPKNPCLFLVAAVGLDQLTMLS